MSQLAFLRSSSHIHNTTWFDYVGVFVLLGLIFGQQIVMVLPLSIGMPTTLFSIAFRGVLLFLSLVLCFRIIAFPTKFSWSKGVLFLIAFLFIYALRLIYDLYIADIYVSPSLGGASKLIQFYFGGIFFPIIGCSVLHFDARKLQKWVFIASFFQCLAISYIFFSIYGAGLDAFVSRHYIATIFDNSDIGQPINPIIISSAGGILAVCSIFVVGINSWFRTLCIGLGCVLLFLGSSRGPMIALLMCFMISLISYLRKGSFEVTLLKAMVIVVALVVGLGSLQSLQESINLGGVNRLIQTFESSGKGEARLTTWSAAWTQFIESPVVGDKIVNQHSNTYPHNLILEILMSVGIVGFIPFIFAMLIGFKIILKNSNSDVRLFSLMFLFLFVSMMVSGSIAMSQYFWAANLLLLKVYNFK